MYTSTRITPYGVRFCHPINMRYAGLKLLIPSNTPGSFASWYAIAVNLQFIADYTELTGNV
jgi:hypothetical protein